MKTFIKAIGTLGSTAGKILVDGGSELAGYTVRTADTVNKSENTYIKRVRESSVKAVYNHGYDRGYEKSQEVQGYGIRGGNGERGNRACWCEGFCIQYKA